MKIPLNEFELVINETILKRGLNYFKNGFVTNLVEVSNGEFEAIVLGTEDYTVNLEIKNEIIVEHNCDCPYDMGPVCKHIVAVIFYLQKDLLEISKNTVKKPRKKRTKSVNQQIKDILKKIPQNELNVFIEDHCKSDRKFRNYFLASFDHHDENQSKEFYQKQIHSILKSAAGRYGFIDWSSMKYVVSAIQPFLDNAEKYLANKNFKNAFYISIALLEEITETLQFADDSSGELGYFIDSSMEILSQISDQKIPDPFREEMFSYCISSFDKKMFSGWDWHLGILYIASGLAKNESEANRIIKSLNTINDEYEKEQAQFFKLRLFRKYKSVNEIDKFISDHIGNSRIRNDEILKAVENKNFDKSIKLAKDGIVYDKKDKPGLVKDWYNWLLKIAQIQKDVTKITEYARFLLIDNFMPEQDYYQILKNNIEIENWYPFLEELISEISSDNNWRSIELKRKIYINEKWWDKLFLMLKQNFTFENIRENEKYLAKDYSTELIAFYNMGIPDFLKNNIGRKHYQKACRYIRRMKKLGGTNEAKLMIEQLRKEYPQRPALMDELNQV